MEHAYLKGEVFLRVKIEMLVNRKEIEEKKVRDNK